MAELGRTQNAAPRTHRAHRRPPKPAILLAVLALGCLAWWLYTELFTPPPRGIFASGTIESEDVSIASEVAGRVTELLAEEGDTVGAGDVLVRLDDSLLQLQYRMASLAERQSLEL
ncbi:MAG: biotin/lipoyl-binding protein, partial [Chloroflexota bacterium]